MFSLVSIGNIYENGLYAFMQECLTLNNNGSRMKILDLQAFFNERYCFFTNKGRGIALKIGHHKDQMLLKDKASLHSDSYQGMGMQQPLTMNVRNP